MHVIPPPPSFLIHLSTWNFLTLSNCSILLQIFPWKYPTVNSIRFFIEVSILEINSSKGVIVSPINISFLTFFNTSRYDILICIWPLILPLVNGITWLQNTSARAVDHTSTLVPCYLCSCSFAARNGNVKVVGSFRDHCVGQIILSISKRITLL